jgi:hypothetical protein
MELAGGRMVHSGWNAIIVDGRITATYPDRDEVIGFFTIISSRRPSILNGEVLVTTRDAEFLVSVLQADKSSVNGTQTWRFVAKRYNPNRTPAATTETADVKDHWATIRD